MLKPPDLVGHVSLTLSASTSADAKDAVPVKHVAPFQRMQDPKAREAHEVALMLPTQPFVSAIKHIVPNKTDEMQRTTDAFFPYATEELSRDHAVFVKPSDPSSQNTGVSLQVRVNELETEVAKLRQQLGKAKGINDTMWDNMVRKLVADGKEQEKGLSNGGEGDEDMQENEGRRKRGRS